MNKMIRTLTILVFFFQAVLPATAQKLPSSISPALQSKPPGYYSDSISLFKYIIEMDPGQAVRYPGISPQHIGWDVYLIHTSPAKLRRFISSDAPYRYIDEQPEPVTEGGVLNYDMSANRITTAWHEFPGVRGEGQTVSVKENRMDTSDIDLLKRFVPSANTSPVGETHATVMTTLIAGAGNSFYTGRGVAPKTRYSSSDFITVLPDTITYYTGLGIRVQNHSYGTGIQNFYGINARAFDLSANAVPELLHVFSSGNSGNQASGQGIYNGIAGFANITGNMKMAKNIMLAGAMDSLGIVPLLSSKGPLHDGRIAPHIVAFGEDGTSGAAALASGLSVLLQQMHAAGMGNSYAGSSLVRAVIANSADDIYTPGPDYTSGFGKMNAAEALQTVMDKRFFTGEIGPFEEKDFVIDVPAGSSDLKVTISWNDPAAASGAQKALVNDLDLQLLAPGGDVIDPWVLNIYPAADSLQKAAEREKDTLNNIEQITVGDPPAGQYVVKVKSGLLKTSVQSFSIAYQVKAMNGFEWDFPYKNDVLVSGNRFLARWTSTMAGNASLEISRNNGGWELLDNSVSLASGSYPVQLGDSAFEFKLRMRAGASDFETGNVLAAPAVQNRFGYVCDTAILNYWNKQPQANSYRLYRLVYDSMQPLLTTTDSSATVARTGSSYFAVAPVINGREAYRGPTIDYTKQNVGCYINNFLADLQLDNTARLQLSLGSLYRVKKVEFRKISRNSAVIYSLDMPSTTNVEYTDPDLQQGLNIYQAFVYLEDGTVISSSQETVYYLNNRLHIIYPNPSPRGTDISVLSEQPGDETALLYDNFGRLLIKVVITEKIQKLPTGNLPAGVYHLRILPDGKPSLRYSFIIL
jgi:Subtilase family